MTKKWNDHEEQCSAFGSTIDNKIHLVSCPTHKNHYDSLREGLNNFFWWKLPQGLPPLLLWKKTKKFHKILSSVSPCFIFCIHSSFQECDQMKHSSNSCDKSCSSLQYYVPICPMCSITCKLIP